MDRLTKRINGIVGPDLEHPERTSPSSWIERLQYRLADYEDTGLMPEEVTRCKLALMGKAVAEITEFEGIPIEWLKELAEAEKEGRLMVLPCKVGDAVWAVGEGQYKKCDIDEVCINRKGEVVFAAYFGCDSECDGCPFNNWHQEYSGEYSCDGEWGQAAIKADDFGKTVFLTREEAEAALKGGTP